jgi:hypothetical protein
MVFDTVKDSTSTTTPANTVASARDREEIMRRGDDVETNVGVQRINTQSDWNACFNAFDGFHDSILREVHLVSKGFVTPERKMYEDFVWDARMIFQSQDKQSPGLELIFDGVSELRLDSTRLYDPQLRVGEGRVELLLTRESSLRAMNIVAKAVGYRLLGNEVLGDHPMVERPTIDG